MEGVPVFLDIHFPENEVAKIPVHKAHRLLAKPG